MNIIEESFQEKQKKDKTKVIKRIILVVIILLVLAIIGIGIAMVYIDKAKLRVYVNGAINEEVKDLLVIQDDGKVYVPIKEIAPYLGYDSYNGDYRDKSEDKSRCYVQCDNEVANFTLNSNKIYKLSTKSTSSTGEDYDYFYSEEPVKAMNGVLYTDTVGFQDAFNTIFNYDKKNNRIQIYTMPYLIQTYTNRVLDYGYSKIDEDFENQKAILDSMLIVQKSGSGTTGVINCDTGEVLIEPKYDDIDYLQDTNDFLVTSNKKVGILSSSGELQIQLVYDSLELMDIDAGLYLAERDDNYGVVGMNGNIVIHLEYDEIGIDITKFTNNDIKNKFILANNLIPVKKDKMWGFFDKTGRQVVDFKYESLGYIASNNRDAMNLLIVPDYNMIVAKRDGKYALVNSSGEEKVPNILDDAYMTVNSGVTYYYMTYNDKRYNIEDYLDTVGVEKIEEGDMSGNSNNTTNNDSSESENNSETGNDGENENAGESENNGENGNDGGDGNGDVDNNENGDSVTPEMFTGDETVN